jgi:hypothetical protein
MAQIPADVKAALESTNLTQEQYDTLARYFGNELLITEAERDPNKPTIRDFVDKNRTGYEFAVFAATRPEVFGGQYGTEAGEKQTNLFRALVNPYMGTSTGKIEQMIDGDSVVTGIRDPYGNLHMAESLGNNEYVIKPYPEIYGEGRLRYAAGFKYKVDDQGNTVLQDIVVDPYQKTSGKFFKTVLPIVAMALGAYYLGPMLSGSAAAGTAGTGAAAGTGATLGTGLTAGAGGATGLTAGAAGVTGLTAPAGFALAPGLGASLAAGGAGISLLDGAATSAMGETGLLADAAGQGLQVPTTPGLSSMGGAQGLTVPVAGGTVSQLGFVPLNATPVLGDPRSFINNPTLLDRPVFTTDSLTMPGQTPPTTPRLRIPNLPGQIFGQPGQPGQPGLMGGGRGGSGQPLTLYEQAQLQAGLLPLAELYRRPSLLG